MPAINCVIPVAFIDRLIRDARARDYEKADFYVIPCERYVYDVVTINLLPTKWRAHPSIITFGCDNRKKCFIEADIVSKEDDIEYVRNRVESMITGEEWGFEVRSCKVVSVHKHGEEYHNHVYCSEVDSGNVANIVEKLIDIARDVEVEKSMHL